MADTPTNGAAEQPKGLREVAEAAYEEVIDQADSEESIEPSSEPQPDLGERQRDSLGRFIAKNTVEGEAEAATPPSPETAPQESERPHPAQAQPGVAAQAPSNWSAEDRANFEKLTQEGKEFLLRRHS